MKRLLCILLIIFLLGCYLFSIFKILMYFSVDQSEFLELSKETPTLYGDEMCFSDDEFLYLVNTKKGNIYVFNHDGNYDGEFNYTLRIPTNGGIVWAGMSDVLYVYAVRTNLLISISGEEYNQTDAYYSSRDDFYDSINLPNVIDTYCGEMVLKAKYEVFSLELCMFLMATSFLSALLLISYYRSKYNTNADSVHDS